MSFSKNQKVFSESIKEWRLVSYIRRETTRGAKHIFTIENMFNGNRRAVSEACVNYLFDRKYFCMMSYIKRAYRTNNWLPTDGMVDFGIAQNYIDRNDGAVIKRYIRQRLRGSHRPIFQEVCRCSRKLLVNLMNTGGMSEWVVCKILNDIPPPSTLTD